MDSWRRATKKDKRTLVAKKPVDSEDMSFEGSESESESSSSVDEEKGKSGVKKSVKFEIKKTTQKPPSRVKKTESPSVSDSESSEEEKKEKLDGFDLKTAEWKKNYDQSP
jgi:hypothetical protein